MIREADMTRGRGRAYAEMKLQNAKQRGVFLEVLSGHVNAA